MLLVKRYGRLLEERPLTTKCITSFFTFGMGDLLCQYFETKYAGRIKWDYMRTVRQGSFGVCVTPYFHMQFCVIMPYLFPATKKINVIKSVVYDQTIGASIFTLGFFTYVDLVSGKTFSQIKEELKVKFLPTLYANWTVWPPLMLINFSIVPVAWRVLFANFCGMFWNAYLSYVQNVKTVQLMSKEKK
jgi:hypothetical protein